MGKIPSLSNSQKVKLHILARTRCNSWQLLKKILNVYLNTHCRRRSTIKNQIQAWAKKQKTRMHQGLRKAKCSRMGVVSPTRKTSLPKQKRYRPDRRTWTHAGIESRAFHSLNKMLDWRHPVEHKDTS